jgi:hypothetical protein
MLLRGYSESSLKAGVGSRAPWMHEGFSVASDTAPRSPLQKCTFLPLSRSLHFIEIKI